MKVAARRQQDLDHGLLAGMRQIDRDRRRQAAGAVYGCDLPPAHGHIDQEKLAVGIGLSQGQTTADYGAGHRLAIGVQHHATYCGCAAKEQQVGCHFLVRHDGGGDGSFFEQHLVDGLHIDGCSRQPLDAVVAVVGSGRQPAPTGVDRNTSGGCDAVGAKDLPLQCAPRRVD